jgi:hypothetical protein
MTLAGLRTWLNRRAVEMPQAASGGPPQAARLATPGQAVGQAMKDAHGPEGLVNSYSFAHFSKRLSKEQSMNYIACDEQSINGQESRRRNHRRLRASFDGHLEVHACPTVSCRPGSRTGRLRPAPFRRLRLQDRPGCRHEDERHPGLPDGLGPPDARPGDPGAANFPTQPDAYAGAAHRHAAGPARLPHLRAPACHAHPHRYPGVRPGRSRQPLRYLRPR